MAGALELTQGAAAALKRRLEGEWFGTAPHRLTLGGRRAQGFSAHPHDLRPASGERGRELLGGVFAFAGSTLKVGANGDPFDRPSPSRRFAAALHGFEWLRDLLVLGDEGVRPAIRLYTDWRRLFGRWNAFSWSPKVLERRVFNLACAARPLAAQASEAEIAFLQDDLARQARHLLRLSEDPSRAIERAVAAGIAGCALGGPAGLALIKSALRRIAKRLPRAVLIDGGHATRSPQRGLELLLDLLTLDDALLQRGVPAPEEMSRAIDRLTTAARFFTLADGRLAAMQGAAAVDSAIIKAALAHEEPRKAPMKLGSVGFHKLAGAGIEVIVDAGAPASGAWSIEATAQPLAFEIVASRDRLITSSGWTAGAPAELRLTAAGSCAVLGGVSCGEPLTGLAASGLGERLAACPQKVTATRHETEGAMWLEMSHDGWVRSFGLVYDRRLFLDRGSGELRGEERFEPKEAKAPDERRYIPVAVHFHLGEGVKASLANDGKTVLLRGPSNEGRWLRTDAAEVAIEPATHQVNGTLRKGSQVVLRGQVLAHKGGRIRWKLSPSET
ncbi:MAG TPA: heparinase II/III family protein [Caulobacteraceae bacterium]|nr:heparinase II/III family protein [Caulobacteraceae bacterium]